MLGSTLGKYRVNGTITDQNLVERVQTWVPNPVFGDMVYEHRYTEYKEFGGDRAALATALVGYHFPFLRTPRRLGWLMLPGLSPGLGTGVQGGWTEISSDGARRAMLALGGDGITPLSRPTDGIRATADVRITLLGDAIGFGMSRAIDHPDRWKPFFGFGLAF